MPAMIENNDSCEGRLVSHWLGTFSGSNRYIFVTGQIQWVNVLAVLEIVCQTAVASASYDVSLVSSGAVLRGSQWGHGPPVRGLLPTPPKSPGLKLSDFVFVLCQKLHILTYDRQKFSGDLWSPLLHPPPPPAPPPESGFVRTAPACYIAWLYYIGWLFHACMRTANETMLRVVCGMTEQGFSILMNSHENHGQEYSV